MFRIEWFLPISQVWITLYGCPNCHSIYDAQTTAQNYLKRISQFAISDSIPVYRIVNLAQ